LFNDNAELVIREEELSLLCKYLDSKGTIYKREEVIYFSRGVQSRNWAHTWTYQANSRYT